MNANAVLILLAGRKIDLQLHSFTVNQLEIESDQAFIPAVMCVEVIAGRDGQIYRQLRRSGFAQTQENMLACTWSYGAITAKGDRLEQLFKDGGGIAPTGANNKAGEFFVWRWSLYRDRLKLVPISPRDLPKLIWTRTSISPSRHYLSKHCPPPAKALPH